MNYVLEDSIALTRSRIHQRGKETLDSICMQFMAIGESLKKVDKLTDGNLLSNYPETDWKGAMGFRDVIAHQYFDIDAEQVFWVCKNEVGPMRRDIARILEKL